jgi:hypothetical protein
MKHKALYCIRLQLSLDKYNVQGLLVLNMKKLIISENKQIKDLATVITNLLSAIPWMGQSFVESTNNIECILPTIGIVSPHALKKG